MNKKKKEKKKELSVTSSDNMIIKYVPDCRTS